MPLFEFTTNNLAYVEMRQMFFAVSEEEAKRILDDDEHIPDLITCSEGIEIYERLELTGPELPSLVERTQWEHPFAELINSIQNAVSQSRTMLNHEGMDESAKLAVEMIARGLEAIAGVAGVERPALKNYAEIRERRDFIGAIIESAWENEPITEWGRTSGARFENDSDGHAMGTEFRIEAPVPDPGDDPEFPSALVDRELIELGISRAKLRTTNLNDMVRGDIINSDRDNDAGDIDETAADAIVQLGLFGEIVYG